MANAAYLYAQEAADLQGAASPVELASPGENTPPDETHTLTPEQNRVDMDIRTSTLSELAAWCRTLGLPEAGTSEDLARRLRDHFKITEQGPQGEDKRKIITIESARSSEYFKIQEVDEEYARLTGDVRITLKDGDAIHQIRAWNILFNRTRNVLTATGGVEYIKTEGDKIETFRGDSITVDLDNWSSIFLGGVSERTLQDDNTTYKFAGTVISRDEEEVIVLNKASISTANNEESLWSISATRVWLLPGSDFAIYNAVLKVGEIPVMYIPFFYYPADEVVFHPVIGYRTREGNFVQTTTYLLGRPKANTSSQSSLTRILGSSSDMEKRREGLFLRSTGKKVTDPDKASLKTLVDYYANLGSYIGTELVLPRKGVLGAFNLEMGVGLTQTVVQDSGTYTPFFPDYDGTTDFPNKSNLFSQEVPFRYRFKTNSSISGRYGSLSWDIPFYSDPLIDSDFTNRAEDMDWVNMIQQGAALEEEEAAQNQLGNYVWQLSGQFTPRLNATPYITSISVSSISSTVSFRTVDNRNNFQINEIERYSPSSFFFSPDTATLISASGSITGTPLSFGGTRANRSAAKPNVAELPDPFKNIGIPRSPFDEKEKEDMQKRSPSDKLVPPELNQRFDLPRFGDTVFSVDYRVAPSAATTLKFDYNKWKEYNDIDWGDITSILNNVGGDASTTLNINHSEGFFTNSLSYIGNGTLRQYGLLNEDATDFQYTSGAEIGQTDPGKVEAAKLQEYRQTFFSTSYNLSSSLFPLFQNDVFKSSSLQYSLRGLAIRSRFDEERGTGNDPRWDLEYSEWAKEKIETHQFTTNLAALVMDKNQIISLTAELPPLNSVLSWRTGFRIWITETDANMRILFPAEEDKRELEPFYLTERFVFGTFGNFTQGMVLNTEEVKVTTLTSALNLTKWGLTISYSAARMFGFEYIPPESGAASTGWVQKTGEEYLQNRDFIINFSKNINMENIWKKRTKLTLNTSSRLFFDLQRYTNSNFTFSLGFTANINKFLDLSLSANSENTVVYRYVKDMAPFNDAEITIPDGDQNNAFFDLINSFRFDDDELRKGSGFKMKNFQITATHYLGDWNAILNWTMAPYRPPNSRQFEVNNEISFLVQWIPISEIKSDVSYNKRNYDETTKRGDWTVKQ